MVEQTMTPFENLAHWINVSHEARSRHRVGSGLGLNKNKREVSYAVVPCIPFKKGCAAWSDIRSVVWRLTVLGVMPAIGVPNDSRNQLRIGALGLAIDQVQRLVNAGRTLLDCGAIRNRGDGSQNGGREILHDVEEAERR